jgi:hypothetical protein
MRLTHKPKINKINRINKERERAAKDREPSVEPEDSRYPGDWGAQVGDPSETKKPGVELGEPGTRRTNPIETTKKLKEPCLLEVF